MKVRKIALFSMLIIMIAAVSPAAPLNRHMMLSFSKDGDVTVGSGFADRWVLRTSECTFDVTRDGQVNGDDLEEFVLHIGGGCSED